MAKFVNGILALFLIAFSGCASISGGRGAASASDAGGDRIQFAGTAYVSVLSRGDRQVEFVERPLELTERALALGGAAGGEERIQLKDIDAIALYPGDVTNPCQLQVQQGQRLFVIQILGAARDNDDRRTQQLYEQLTSYGVPRTRTEQFYYVGMNLEEVKDAGGNGFFAAAAGARLGSFIWDSIKGLGRLLAKPFVPLF